MLILNRQIKVVEENNPTRRYSNSQASVNSDGYITLRNYNDGTEDEIIILSPSESKAIFKLMHVLKNANPELLIGGGE